MNKLVRLMRNRIIFLVIILCFLRQCATFEALSSRNASEKASDAANWRSTTFQKLSEKNKGSTIRVEDFEREIAGERPSRVLKNENPIKETKGNFVDIKKVFEPFMSFPFLSFHMPDMKASNAMEKANLLKKDNESGGSRSPRKSKPFLFIDLALNIQEIPMRNGTAEEKPSGNGSRDSLLNTYSKKGRDKREGKLVKTRDRNQYLPFDFLQDDWSLFDDLALLPRGVDDFLPNSKFRFLDLPFRGKGMNKQSRSRKDKALVPRKSDTDPVLSIFDEAMSRMKREMKKTVPLWEYMRGVRKTIGSEEGTRSVPFLDGEILLPQDPENKGNKSIETNLVKPIPNEKLIDKSPILAGKLVKIGEMHVRDDYPESKKKRRKSWVMGKKEKEGHRENSIKTSHVDQACKEKLWDYRYVPPSVKDVFVKVKEEKSERRKGVRGTQDAKILDLMAQWDRKEMEEELEGKNRKMESLEMYNKKEREKENVSGGGGALMLKDKGFKYEAQIPRHKEILTNNGGFQVLKPQESSRRKRQENDGGGTWENVTASKEEIRRNITHVLGQFFSMIKKLGEPKKLHQEKENEEIDEIIWPELGKLHGSRSHGPPHENRLREEREAETEERDRPPPVADLTYLFLSVTLPTTLAFTLVLVICFINLRPTSWLCQKVFQPRNLYIVEEDVEVSRPTGIEPIIRRESYKKNEAYKKVELKEEEEEEDAGMKITTPEREADGEEKNEIDTNEKDSGERKE